MVTGQWRANFQGKVIPGDICSPTRDLTTPAVFYMRAPQATKRPSPYRSVSSIRRQDAARLTRCNRYKLHHAPRKMVSEQTGPGFTCLHRTDAKMFLLEMNRNVRRSSKHRQSFTVDVNKLSAPRRAYQEQTYSFPSHCFW